MIVVRQIITLAKVNVMTNNCKLTVVYKIWMNLKDAVPIVNSP